LICAAPLTKNGAGTLTSSAVNSFNGPITINGDTLEFTATNGGNKVFGSTQININGASTLKVSGTVANIPIFKAANYTFDSIGGGKIELGAGGNYDAGVSNEPFSITTQGGAVNTIKIIGDGVSGANGFNLGGSVATFNVALGTDPASDLTVTPIMSNGGSVLKTGTGRLTLAGANTYAGSTTVTGGTLTLGAAA
jgi:fibronectin-binding autotransporter adhesin